MRPDDPQDLESALAAYRRLPRTEPPAALDAAIRARARASATTRSRPRWPLLFATAATLVLAASLGWRTWRDGAQQPAPLAPPEAAKEAIVPAGVTAEVAAEAVPGAGSTANAASGTPPLQDARARAEEPARAAPARPVAEPVEQRSDRAPQVPEPSMPPLPQAASRAAADAAQEPEAAPAPPAPAAPAPRPVAEAAPTSIDARSSLGSLRKAEAPPSEAEVDALRAAAEVEAAPGADAPAAAPVAVGATPAMPATAGVGRDLARRQASAGNASAVALEPIRELLRQGRRAEARQALERWRRDWPDAELPEDLRALLQ